MKRRSLLKAFLGLPALALAPLVVASEPTDVDNIHVLSMSGPFFCTDEMEIDYHIFGKPLFERAFPLTEYGFAEKVNDG